MERKPICKIGDVLTLNWKETCPDKLEEYHYNLLNSIIRVLDVSKHNFEFCYQIDDTDGHCWVFDDEIDTVNGNPI